MIVDGFNLFFGTRNEIFRFVRIEFQDTSHLYFHELENILFGHLTNERRIKGSQPIINVRAGSIHVFGLFKLLILIYTLFDEYLFERCKVQTLLQLVFVNLQFET
ncbi:hypothetical protein SDC9_109942 [bioreactor metagenome]|uniref:Uncharacterized protein n=1 Tax=bioreactor metagenome TaxID=1076179 RepID=A0A645BMP5_9ZZZZ